MLRRMERLRDIDTQGLNNTIAQAVRTSTVKRFRTQAGPDGKRWEPSRRVRERGGVTLTDSARLRNSIRSKTGRDGFAVGTNVVYAATHQLGAKSRTIRAKTARGLRFNIGGRWITRRAVTVNIPARPFLGVSQDDAEEIKATIDEYLTREV